MFGNSFYFGTIKQYVIMFGSLFSEIYISRKDENGISQQSILVPISYGPRERYMVRAIQNPDLMRPLSYVFPRMAFQITNFRYAEERKLNTVGQINNGNSYKGTLTTQYNPVPYDISIRLSVICRNTEDGLEIIEQIVPFFTPEWTVSLNLIPALNEQKDIPVVIQSLKTEEHYEGQFTEKQFTTWDIDFILKGYLYGPYNRDKIIKIVDVNFFTPETNTISEGVGNSQLQEYIQVTPGLDANGNPTTIAANSIPIANIAANSNYGFVDEIINVTTK